MRYFTSLLILLFAVLTSIPVMAADAPVITDPQGTRKEFITSGDGYIMFSGIIMARWPFDNAPTNIVYSPDGAKAYIYNPVQNFPTSSYVEADIAENGDIVIPLPQLVWSRMENGELVEYYAQVLDRTAGSDEIVSYETSATRDNITLTLKENGSYAMEECEGEWILGLIDADGEWQGFGTFNAVYKPNDYKLLTPPADLTTETWQLISDNYGHNIEIGFSGSDVYIKGFTIYAPEVWIKGTLSGDRITFKSGQYLGKLDDMQYLGFLYRGEKVVTESGMRSYYITPEQDIVFIYDKDKRYMSSEDIIVLNNSDEYTSWCDAYEHPIAHTAEGEHSFVPANISPVAYLPYTDMEGYGGYQFYQPNYSVDNYMLDIDKLYYQVYFDEDPNPFCFYPDEYFSLEEETTFAPYTMDSAEMWNVYNPNNWSSPLHTFLFFFPVEKSIGVVSVYKKSETEIYRSQQVAIYLNGADGVESIEANATDEPAIYYDLQGRRVEFPIHGQLYIVRQGDKTFKQIYR